MPYFNKAVPVFGLICVLLASLLSGCGTVGPVSSKRADSALQSRAASLEATGNYRGAAQLYLQAARQANGTAQHALQLQAVDSLLRGNEHAEAARLLDALPQEQLSGEHRQRYTLGRAAIALGNQRPDKALSLLQHVPDSSPLVADYYRLRAAAWSQNSHYYRSATELVRLDPLLTDPHDLQANRKAIWEAVNSLTDSELQTLRTAPPPDTLGGWMELVELTRLYLQQPEALSSVIPHWQQRYPAHPASDTFIGHLLQTMRTAGQPPAQVAVLLPLTGSLANAAGAIRDGIFAAYYDTPAGGTQPQLQIFDSGDTPETAIAAYQDAVAQGARFVIGPLRKDSVQALATLHPLPVPVLGLNQVNDQSLYVPTLYQFGLAPEDEAREVARLAWRKGYTRSIALLPDTAWGERVFAAFTQEWELLGGTVIEAQRYDPKKADHGKVIKSVLNLNSSKARHQELTRHLGRTLSFEPRRRQDADFVFLVASPRQARLIRPQLNFYRASDLPVYATSRVYAGHPDRRNDADMNGIIFCDTPWTLEQRASWEHLKQTIAEFWPESTTRFSRLYALGIDAYRIVPYLGELDNGMFDAYHGVTGNLSLDENGRINRSLRCATFKRGQPAILEADTEGMAANNTTHH